MYKDKEKQREATRERVRRYREKGVTSSTVDKALQGKELTLEVAKEMSMPTVDNVDYNFKVPERAKVLPPDVIKGILACLRGRADVRGEKHALFDDSEARWDRAINYHNWRLSYKTSGNASLMLTSSLKYGSHKKHFAN